MITAKELRRMIELQQELDNERKQKEFSALVRWVEKACKKAACDGLYTTTFHIPTHYIWATNQLVQKLIEVGFVVIITKKCDHNLNYEEILNINWDGKQKDSSHNPLKRYATGQRALRALFWPENYEK